MRGIRVFCLFAVFDQMSVFFSCLFAVDQIHRRATNKTVTLDIKSRFRLPVCRNLLPPISFSMNCSSPPTSFVYSFNKMSPYRYCVHLLIAQVSLTIQPPIQRPICLSVCRCVGVFFWRVRRPRETALAWPSDGRRWREEKRGEGRRRGERGEHVWPRFRISVRDQEWQIM